MKCALQVPAGASSRTTPGEENRRRAAATDPSTSSADTGVFDDDRYFDVMVEYAKAAPDDILIRITVTNRGPEAATLHLLPHALVSQHLVVGRSSTVSPQTSARAGRDARRRSHDSVTLRLRRRRRLDCWRPPPELLFTENETNTTRSVGPPNATPFVKDAFHEYVIRRATARRQSERSSAPRPPRIYACDSRPGATLTVCDSALRASCSRADPVRREFDRLFDRAGSTRPTSSTRAASAAVLIAPTERRVQRQAFAGLLWIKQFYHYDVARLARRRSRASRRRPPSAQHGRNRDWTHLYNADVISMPDKWEYPVVRRVGPGVPLRPARAASIPTFAKEQLLLLLREWYMHPNGQIPAYEWAFGDVNPPVHAWAAWRVYKIEQRRTRHRRPRLPRARLPQAAAQLHLVGQPQGRRRQQRLPGRLPRPRQHRRLRPQRSRCPPAGTSSRPTAPPGWRMYCLNMLAIALELAQRRSGATRTWRPSSSSTSSTSPTP